jgi:hypothetical protein
VRARIQVKHRTTGTLSMANRLAASILVAIGMAFLPGGGLVAAPAPSGSGSAVPSKSLPVSVSAKPPVDSKAEDEKAAQVFESLYGEALKRAAATPGGADDVTLAMKLVADAKLPTVSHALQVILCQKACELGALDPKGYDVVMDAASLLTTRAPEKAEASLEIDLSVRQRLYEAARAEDRYRTGENFIERLLYTGLARAAIGDFDEAVRRFRHAVVVARAIRSTSADDLDALVKRYVDMQKISVRIAQLKVALAADPAKRDVRDQLVRLWVTEFDNPVEAAKWLDESSDPALRKYVPAAVRSFEAAPELACLELADWYRDLVAVATLPSGKAAMLNRMVNYYRHFLDLHKTADLDRTKAELAVKSAEVELDKMAAATNRNRWFDLLRILDPVRNLAGGTAQRTDAGLVIAGTKSSSVGKVAIPLTPTGGYDLEAKFARIQGSADVGFILPVGSSAVFLNFGGWDNSLSGIENIQGKRLDNLDSTVKAGLKNGQLYTLHVRVTLDGSQASIVVTLDGKPFTKWAGPVSALSLDKAWVLPTNLSFGLATWQSTGAFQTVRMRMITPRVETPKPVPPYPAPKG